MGPSNVDSGVTGLYGYAVICTVMRPFASGGVTVMSAFVCATVSPLFIPTM